MDYIPFYDPARAEQLKIKRGTVELREASGADAQLTSTLRAGANQIVSLVQSLDATEPALVRRASAVPRYRPSRRGFVGS